MLHNTRKEGEVLRIFVDNSSTWTANEKCMETFVHATIGQTYNTKYETVAKGNQFCVATTHTTAVHVANQVFNAMILGYVVFAMH